MHLPLSRRLEVCAGFVAQGDRVADIGCDHGYLGIHLLQQGIAASVIAADINEMPLQSAMRNAEKYGFRDRMQFFLSNGAQKIPRDFDTMICAGMGADTMISILEGASWLRDAQYRLILQCQSKTPALRRYLSEQGWCVRRETVLCDGRFLYTVMEVLWQPEAPKLSIGQCYFPPALLLCPTQELQEYYEGVLFRLRRAISGQGPHADADMVQALRELESDPKLFHLKEKKNDNC